jgi:GH24 family phage-related lysozyme (muramidase)
MAWNGGFTGVGFTREEFNKYLKTKPKPAYSRIVIHNTDAPYIKPPVIPAQRVQNIAVHYKNMGWSGGPDFFAFYNDRVYLGSPMGKSVGCKGWNGNSFHIEAEGKYTKASGHDPLEGDGGKTWDTMAWVCAELLAWMGWEANHNTIKFHKEGLTTHDCPGHLVTKIWFIPKVKAAMTGNPFYPEKLTSTEKLGVKPTPVKRERSTIRKGSSGGDVPVLQLALRATGVYILADGDFGPKTEALVKAFQKAQGLVADGIVGPKTWTALDKAVKKPDVAPTAPEPKPIPEPTPEPKPAPEPPVVVGTKREPIADMHMSKKGLDLLKHFEGLRLAPYDDNGSLAIGYGHSNRSRKPPIVTESLRISAAEASDILASDLLDYENRVKQSIAVPLKQGEFDALVSLAYNWGPGNLDRSELKQLVNAGRYEEAEAEIRTILPSSDKKYYAGIKRRRGKEADLFGSEVT